MSTPIAPVERQRSTASLLYFAARLRRVLGAPHAELVVIALSVALLACSFDAGIVADDYVHARMLDGAQTLPALRRPSYDLFRFAGGAATRALLEEGSLTWWDHPSSQLAFLRPVSAYTHALDHWLWPHTPALWHLHSAAWALLALLAARAYFRTLLGSGFSCVLALCLFALDDSRSWFTAWVAARSGVIATTFGIWALVWHHRSRTLAARPLLGPCFLLLGLLAGEGASAALAYMVLHALFLDRAAWRERCAALMPYFGVTLVWFAAYRALGYGVRGSGMYADPLQDPLGALAMFAEHAPILLLSQLAGLWSDLWDPLFVFPRLRSVIWCGGIGVIILYASLLRPLWRRDPVVRYAVLAALASLVTVTGAFPTDRLLVWVALGAAVVFARWLTTLIDEPTVLQYGPRATRVASLTANGFLVVQLGLNPLLIAPRARGIMPFAHMLERCDGAVPKNAAVQDKLAIFVNPPAVPLVAFIPVMRAVRAEPRPRGQRILATATTALTVERVDAHTLRLRACDGFLRNPSSWLLRKPTTPFQLGQRLGWSDPIIIVEEITAAGVAVVISARFSKPLEDTNYVWRYWGGASLEPFTPPALHAAVELEAADYFQVLFGHKLGIPATLPCP